MEVMLQLRLMAEGMMGQEEEEGRMLVEGWRNDLVEV